jgi:serine/threonine protein kinase
MTEATLPRELDSGHVLVEEIGRGGMGVVYRGLDTTNMTPVAVKMLALRSDPTADERMFREARILAQIKNPHVVELLEYGRTPNGEIYLIMEFLDGIPLSEHMHLKKALSLSATVHIAKQIAQGVEAAHGLGMVHRDLKAANIMVVDGEDNPLLVKVLDFGVAKHAGEGKSSLTKTGMVMGTLPSMSPEQLLGEPVDERTDVYALGALMYAMVTGHPPHEGNDDKNIVHQILRGVPIAPSKRLPAKSIPSHFDQIILRALEKAPSKRFGSMQALLEALREHDFGEVDRKRDGLPEKAMHRKQNTLARKAPGGDRAKSASVPGSEFVSLTVVPEVSAQKLVWPSTGKRDDTHVTTEVVASPVVHDIHDAETKLQSEEDNGDDGQSAAIGGIDADSDNGDGN